MPKIKSVREAELQGKRVLLRVDFNVPLEGGVVMDDTRIKAALPTLEFLHEKGAAKILILTHLGRPKGKVEEALRVAPVEARLRELISESKLAEKMIWPDARSPRRASGDPRTFSKQVLTEITVHENLRFDPREEQNDESFARELAQMGDLYVNEAFPVSHRRDASIVGVPKFLPSFVGLRFEEEILKLTPALTPQDPAVAIIGGAKFETKVPLIEKLLQSYDKILLGGALANDLLKARGLPIGSSLISELPAPVAIAGSSRLLVPQDVAVVEEATRMGRTTYTSDVRAGEKILDIGPTTIELWSKEVAEASFVLWNGPVGMYEAGYIEGTDGLARALANSSAQAVVGGGDTIAALSRFSFDNKRIFVSTGGGAMLEFLTAGSLPGIDALLK